MNGSSQGCQAAWAAAARCSRLVLGYRDRVRARTEWESVDAIPSRLRYGIVTLQLLTSCWPFVTLALFLSAVCLLLRTCHRFGLRGACGFLRTGSHNIALSCSLPLPLVYAFNASIY